MPLSMHHESIVLRLVMLMAKITATPRTMPMMVSSMREGLAPRERMAMEMVCLILAVLSRV